MENLHLLPQIALMRKSFFEQGFLDAQFIQLEQLQDNGSPNFVEEVVTLFFNDSSRLIILIETELEKNPPDYKKLDTYMHQIKGSSASIGAQKVSATCSLFRDYCELTNRDGCLRALQLLKKEHAIIKKKLETYFQMLRQAGPAETATRPK